MFTPRDWFTFYKNANKIIRSIETIFYTVINFQNNMYFMLKKKIFTAIFSWKSQFKKIAFEFILLGLKFSTHVAHFVGPTRRDVG